MSSEEQSKRRGMVPVCCKMQISPNNIFVTIADTALAATLSAKGLLHFQGRARWHRSDAVAEPGWSLPWVMCRRGWWPRSRGSSASLRARGPNLNCPSNDPLGQC